MPVVIVPVGRLRQYVGDQDSVALEWRGKTVLQILEDLHIPGDMVSAVLLNDVLVPKDHVPRDGDSVKLVSVLGGG